VRREEETVGEERGSTWLKREEGEDGVAWKERNNKLGLGFNKKDK